MDILTVKGQKTLSDEREAIRIFLSNCPEYSIIETPKNQPSDFDGFLVREGKVISVIETKCRYDCDIDKFKNQYDSYWLVTFDKILRIMNVSESMKVSVTGFLYIVPSGILLVKTIFQKGILLTDMKVKATETKRSVNGGMAFRTNAYINMSLAKELKLELKNGT